MAIAVVMAFNVMRDRIVSLEGNPEAAAASYLFLGFTSFGRWFTRLWPLVVPLLPFALLISLIRVASLQIRASGLMSVGDELLRLGVLAGILVLLAMAAVLCFRSCRLICEALAERKPAGEKQ